MSKNIMLHKTKALRKTNLICHLEYLMTSKDMRFKMLRVSKSKTTA